jgi:hypothetical protein
MPMATTPLRHDLQQLLDELDAVDRAVDILVAPLSDAQFFWQPNEGRSWSIAQCLEHLAVANTLYADGIAAGLAAARARRRTGGGPIASSVFGRLFVSSMEPPVKRRMRAPSKILPTPDRTREEIMRSFRETHARVREHIRAAADIDVNRATFMNPFLRVVRMRVGTAFRVITAHDRRHVWQAENVRRAPGFPTAG